MKRIFALTFFLMNILTSPSAHAAEAKAYFAGGCFWCLEAAFESLDGVTEAISGYMRIDNATEKTEVVEVHYDPAKIGYPKLAEIYWQNIDPDDANGQFYDRGQHYRTAIFYQNADEKAQAEQSKKDAETLLNRKLAPLIVEAGRFIIAEESHQNFYQTNSDHYNRYKKGSGRPDKLKEVWGDKAKH